MITLFEIATTILSPYLKVSGLYIFQVCYALYFWLIYWFSKKRMHMAVWMFVFKILVSIPLRCTRWWTGNLLTQSNLGTVKFF